MSASISSLTTGLTSASATSVAPATTSSAGMSGHGAMSMGGASCKISMMWNWYTIDACFLTPSWRIRNGGMFAATCVGVALLVVALEFFRRLGKEYDALIIRQFRQNLASKTVPIQTVETPAVAVFRATPLQQFTRAVLHATVFGLAYIIMLLAMYYNGYIIMSIVVGAGLGKFFCDWDVCTLPQVASTYGAGSNIKHNVDEASVCCG